MSEDKSNLQKILEFSNLLINFRLVIRGVLTNGEERFENSVEHSYMLAMLADYIISLDNLSLNREKVMRYALVHDVIEVYAGDTYAYTKDQDFKDSKTKREVDALERLKSEFPEFMNMWNIVETYEGKKDDESRFVYALDKVQPTIHIYLDNGRSWQKNKVTFADMLTYKGEKVKISPEVMKYWQEFLQILERNQSTLFSK